jgi:hypothetical protein
MMFVSCSTATRLLVLVCATLWLPACASCGGTPELNQGRVHSDLNSFELGLPGEGWRALSVPGANAAWMRVGTSASLLVNSQCDKGDAPLAALTQELLFGTTERNVIHEQTLPMAGREALETLVELKLDGVLRRRQVRVLKKDDCVYDFVLDASVDEFPQSLPGYEAVLDGFATQPRPR